MRAHRIIHPKRIDQPQEVDRRIQIALSIVKKKQELRRGAPLKKVS
jgi:hypothetical protein